MINKFKAWLAKFKKNKQDSSDIPLDETGTQLHLSVQDDGTEPDQTPMDAPQVLTRDALDQEQAPVQDSKTETSEEVNSDRTQEINLSELNEELDQTNPAMTVQQESNITSTNTNADGSLDLSKELTFKDKLAIYGQKVKDKIDRIDFRKFKNFRIPTKENGGADNGPSLTQQISQRYNLRIPKSVEQFEYKVKRFPWHNLHNEVFHPKNRSSINKVFLALLLLMTPYYIGKTIGLILKGTNDYKNLNNNVALKIDYSKEIKPSQINDVKIAKLFKTEKQTSTDPSKPVVITPTVCKTATKRSDLPIKLINTIVLQDSVKSIASVQIRNKEMADLREGDKIEQMAKVDKIDRLEIIVKNLADGNCESISSVQLAQKSSPVSVLNKAQSKTFLANKKIPGIENEGNNFKIKRAFLEEKMKNIADVLTQARGVQIPNPDGTLAFKIVDVEPGGIFAYLGIQENDIITHINGKKINDLNEVMSLFSNVTKLNQLNLTVRRGGEEVPLDYKLQ